MRSTRVKFIDKIKLYEFYRQNRDGELYQSAGAGENIPGEGGQ